MGSLWSEKELENKNGRFGEIMYASTRKQFEIKCGECDYKSSCIEKY